MRDRAFGGQVQQPLAVRRCRCGRPGARAQAHPQRKPSQNEEDIGELLALPSSLRVLMTTTGVAEVEGRPVSWRVHGGLSKERKRSSCGGKGRAMAGRNRTQ